MKFINFAVVKFVLLLISGILTAHFFTASLLFLTILIPLFVILFGVFLYDRKQLFQTKYFAIITYLCFFSLGYFSYQIRLPQFQKNHYSKCISENKSEFIQLKIEQQLKPDNYNHKYIAKVLKVGKTRSQGKVLYIVLKDSLKEIFKPDELVMVYSNISEIPKPLNPYQFDYSKYMASLGVYGQIKSSHNQILSLKKGKPTIKGTAENVRQFVIHKLEKTDLKRPQRGILQALILGDKKDVDKQLYTEYASAGAVHILAVSGLHVGIIYMILGFLLRPLHYFRYGNSIKYGLIILLLWGFAMLSGLSPSVTRAVTMFSFFALAQIVDRPTNSMNTLFLSLLALLTFNPLWLFQVGFQLSYLAVFFIIWLYPKLYRLGYSNKWYLRKGWSIISVTLCAQLGVLPLTLYYFHQFPGLFLVTNLAILPFLMALMCFGIIVTLFAVVWTVPNWLAFAYNSTIEYLNKLIHWVSVQDEFLFRDIHFSEAKVIGSYFAIAAAVLLWKHFSFRRLAVSLASISLLIGIFVWDEYQNSSNEFVVFHKNRSSIIGIKTGNEFIYFKNDTFNQKENFPLKPYMVSRNITKYSEMKIPKIFSFNHRNILIVDSLGIYPKSENIHTVVLSNSPKINLSRLIDSLKPKQIIADGNNYRSYVARWEASCLAKKIPFVHTAKTGAIVVE
ncbi:ComEC/Rec2 family competence protein [Aequorivita echinoideorum]|uniref:ComEC/Rec2 family competence protein n=1 Tax=Aequorivita echinoideorum TaxID=1549647 RepID=A0ABS5S063_9FLAO|nr:ComEC/Rec2 family competence protein [Aequorivita echinoideorum]MBT0606560.1 ComEC/Rec2 family competence protein [Aequorivita echinoideorum]